jgi:hypothetical protein
MLLGTVLRTCWELGERDGNTLRRKKLGLLDGMKSLLSDHMKILVLKPSITIFMYKERGVWVYIHVVGF